MLYSAKKNTNKNVAIETATIINRDSKMEHILSILTAKFKNKHAVSVLNLSGVIGKSASAMKSSSMSIDSLNKLIEKAFNVPKLAAVCLSVNSPGGSPVQSELIAKRIRSLALEKNIKVYAFIQDVAASGGYWLALSADELYASKSSIIGSVGVVSAGFGMTGMIDKLGIERRVYAQGKNKVILDPFQPVKQDDVKIIKSIQKEIHEYFIDYVKDRRAGKLTQSDDMLFNGEFWTGEKAVAFGLIDGIDDMYNFIQNKFGVDIKFEYIEQKQSFLKKTFNVFARPTALSSNNLPSEDLAQHLVEHLIQNIDHKTKYAKFDTHF